MRVLCHIFLILACSGLTVQADRGTHEWVVRAPGGLYGLIQYDWVQSTTDDRSWSINEVNWPISATTHKVHSYTFIYVGQRRLSLPVSAPAVAFSLVSVLGIAGLGAGIFFRRSKRVT